MAPLRILVVDDSVVIRKVLSETLASDQELEIVGIASDGKIGLAKIAQLHPDLVTLDVEMPVMNGLETLVEVRKLYPQLPVIMFSTLTERGAAATLDALSLGASDYVTKPSNTGSMAGAIERIKADLIPKIKALCGRRRPKPAQASPVVVAPPTVIRPRPKPGVRRPIQIVAIGTSTGGPNALAEVLPEIPKDFPVPIVAVQHMPPLFTKMLADRLASRGKHSDRRRRGRHNPDAGPRMVSAGKFSYDRETRRGELAPWVESGGAGKFLQTCGGRLVPLRRFNIWTQRACRRYDGNGLGWTAWSKENLRSWRSSDRAG